MARADGLTEAEFQRQVVDLAAVCGWLHVHFRPAQTSKGWRTPVSGPLGKGFPDLMLIRERDRRLIFAELKRDGAKTTPDQDRVLASLDWLALGDGKRLEVYVWHPADFDKIVAVLR
jgi:VRR-NUC domain